jgi:hypothetical protein
VAHIEEMRNAYRVLVGKTEGKIPLWRPRCTSKHNIKIDLIMNRTGESELH